MAYLFTMIALNFAYWLYNKIQFKLQPFDASFIKIIIISVVALAPGILLPKMDFYILDILLRSAVVGGIFVGLVYIMKISTDINEFIEQIISKIKFK